jgi:ABC-type phosphate/phosphonate transport system substrate-binding protein
MPPSHFAVCPHDTARGLTKWALFNTLVNKEVGLGSRFHPYLNFAEFGVALEAGELLWAYLNPADFLKAKRLFQYEHIARPADRRDIAYLVAPARSGFRSLEAASGRRVAAVKGYLYFLVKHRLRASGIEHELVPAKSYPEVMQLVERGQAELGVTYNDHFDRLNDISRADFVIAAAVDIGLSHVVATHPSVPTESREALRNLLLGAAVGVAGEKILSTLEIARFEPVPEEPFGQLADVIQSVGG